jgi:hypothetical protein
MSDWQRLRESDTQIAAVIETSRDGFIVSIREVRDGMVEEIISDKDAAVAESRNVEVGFRRAMDKAEAILEEREQREEPPRAARRRAPPRK